MLNITKEQIQKYKNYPILLIDDLTKEYIINELINLLDFSELEQEFGYVYDEEDKRTNLIESIYINGYGTGTQHSPNNIYISIYLSHIHSKYTDYSINYYTEPRAFDGTIDEIMDELAKYLEVFNKEFDEVLEGIKLTNKKMEKELNFGKVLESLKEGKKVARKGWNGGNMYLTLIQGYPVNEHLNPASNNKEDDDIFSVPGLNPDDSKNITKHNPGQMLSHIVMKITGDSLYWGKGFSDYITWTASQTDILSEDWFIVD